ncbi:hypothetical protein FRC09_013401, partial [Ceratobasidium sp. 395]
MTDNPEDSKKGIRAKLKGIKPPPFASILNPRTGFLEKRSMNSISDSTSSGKRNRHPSSSDSGSDGASTPKTHKKPRSIIDSDSISDLPSPSNSILELVKTENDNADMTTDNPIPPS